MEEEEEEEYQEVQRSTKEEQIASSTEPKEAVRLNTLLLDRNKRTAKWKAPPDPPLSPAEVGWKRK